MNSNSIIRCVTYVCLSQRTIGKCLYATKSHPTNLGKWSKSSQEWMTRQINDPYVKLAKRENYRARSAFKLIEIDDKYKILQPGQLVVDCGASPGAWTQVAVSRINANNPDSTKKVGKVISVDINFVSPVKGAISICGDLTLPSTQTQIIEQFGDERPDVVLSDMAPNASGIRDLDNQIIVNLSLAALAFAVKNLKRDGTFLCKIWDGRETNKLETNVIKFFSSVKRVKPQASRSDSSELFILGRQFKGLG